MKQLVNYETYEGKKLNVAIKNIKYDGEGRIVEGTGNSIDYEERKMYEVTSTVSYLPGRITSQNKSNEETSTGTYILDKYDRIVEEQKEDETRLFFYDKHNQLTLVKDTYKDYTKEIAITWKDGNIVRVAMEGAVFNYVYSTLPADNFIGRHTLVSLPYINEVSPILFKEGYYGAYPKNLIQSYNCSQTIIDNGEKEMVNFECTNTYTFDKDNYVTKVVGSNGYSETFTWK